MCGRHVASRESHRKSGSNAPESPKSGPKPVSAWGARRQGVRWIRVADREADIYEYLVSCQELGHGFVIRAAKDRALSHPETGKRTGRLFTAARSAVPLGEFTLELRQRPQHPARTAHLCVSATAVTLSAPWRPGYGRSRKPPSNAPPCASGKSLPQTLGTDWNGSCCVMPKWQTSRRRVHVLCNIPHAG